MAGLALPAELLSADSRGRLSPQEPFLFFFPFADEASAGISTGLVLDYWLYLRRSGDLIFLSLAEERSPSAASERQQA